ncbi:MAG: acetyl-CoA hydrolase/transferase family protein [Deltaproteobacteria bacterium]|nr:acetyl-CoA hydrolase/transferase family protein [Deltaproteobacteria bacterium]
MDWVEDYKRKLVSAEDAVKLIKSGDKIYCPLDSEPRAIGLALAARIKDLKNLEIEVAAPTLDLGWYDEWATSSTNIKVGFIPRFATERLSLASKEKRVDMVCKESSLYLKAALEGRPGERQADICMLELSTPDINGYCSFGNSMWDKKMNVLHSKVVLAQVNPNSIRTYGDNFIHVSQIDYFVESDKGGSDRFRDVMEVKPEPEAVKIAEYVNSLINDGDTMMMGIGQLIESLVPAGVFNGKNDLGWHTERTPRGTVKLIREGIFTGKYKSINRGKIVATCVPLSPGDEDFVNMNPMIELYDVSYTNSIPVIASSDNQLSICGGISIDLTGQFTGESIGPQIYSGTGGLPNFIIGTAHAKGGRSIIVMPSTAGGGKISRIVPMLPEGTIITVTRPYIDYVVTEFGIANLFGKSQRERASQLIAIAHPDHRDYLKDECKRLFG